MLYYKAHATKSANRLSGTFAFRIYFQQRYLILRKLFSARYTPDDRHARYDFASYFSQFLPSQKCFFRFQPDLFGTLQYWLDKILLTNIVVYAMLQY